MRLLVNAKISDEIVGFHAQQAVEKWLKAVLGSRGIEFEYTHDLRRLIAEVTAVVGNFHSITRRWLSSPNTRCRCATTRSWTPSRSTARPPLPWSMPSAIGRLLSFLPAASSSELSRRHVGRGGSGKNLVPKLVPNSS